MYLFIIDLITTGTERVNVCEDEYDGQGVEVIIYTTNLMCPISVLDGMLHPVLSILDSGHQTCIGWFKTADRSVTIRYVSIS